MRALGVEEAWYVFRREKPVRGAADVDRDGWPCIVDVLAVFSLEDQTEVVLQVERDGAPPYQAQVGLDLPEAAVPVVFPGARLPGRWLPDGGLLTIDFPALQA